MAPARHRGQNHPYARLSRVNALLREVLAEGLERLIDADERLSLVTVTGVVCEADLRRALVYVAALSPEVAAALSDHRRELQSMIAREVRMKHVPVLSFALDPAIESGERVEAALRRALRSRPDEPPA